MRPASRTGGSLAPARIPVPRGAAEQLQAMIKRQQLRPGDQLPAQRELAEQLKISRASLREALSALETIGVVVVQPGRGVFVAEPVSDSQRWRFADKATPSDVYEARYCLEGFAAGIAATRLDEASIDELRRSVLALRRAFEQSDVEGMAIADSAFHDLIIEVCANPILTAMYKSVRELMTESQKLPMRHKTRLVDTVLEHESLLARLEVGDASGASELMKRHIRLAAGRYGLDLNGYEGQLSKHENKGALRVRRRSDQ
jgi:GntR family transcriptional regulator, transcriptional repressor for pyruvate dehydrogenase complex